MEEPQDAAQEAMIDFFSRARAGQAFSSPARLCVPGGDRFFVKYRQRDRERQPRQDQDGHLTLPAYLDDELTRLRGRTIGSSMCSIPDTGSAWICSAGHGQR